MLRVALLHRHGEIDALGLQFGNQIVHVAANSAQVRRDRGGVHEDANGFGREGGRHNGLRF